MQRNLLAIFAIVASLPSLAYAQETNTQALTLAAAPADQGPEASVEQDQPRTHEGFMLSGRAGLALLGTGLDHGRGASTGAGGVGNAFSLSVGGYLIPNLALHADLFRAASSYMVVETDDSDIPRTHGNNFELNAAGMGMTYFVMPYNLSLSGSLMVGRMNLDRPTGSGREAHYCVLGKFGIAKQWAMADALDLGIGATLLAGAGYEDEAFEVGIGGFSIDAIATYD